MTAANGAIYLDRDLGGDLVVGGTSTPQPVGSVMLKAGGTDTFQRTYYGGPFNGDTGVVTAPNIPRNGIFAVRVRGIKSNGPVTIDGQTTIGEILLDGVVDAKGNVSLLANAIRARHSVFAEGGDITVGGRLILEPWGDEIVVGISNPVTITTNTYPTQRTDSGAPGSLLTDPPAVSRISGSTEGEDAASSQITLRAIRVGGTTGGQIFLTNGAGVEPGTPQGSGVLAAMRTDQQHVRLDRGANTNGLVNARAGRPDEPAARAAQRYPAEPSGRCGGGVPRRSGGRNLPVLRRSRDARVNPVQQPGGEADDPGCRRQPGCRPVHRSRRDETRGAVLRGVDEREQCAQY